MYIVLCYCVCVVKVVAFIAICVNVDFVHICMPVPNYVISHEVNAVVLDTFPFY